MSEFSCFDSAEALALNQARMDHFLKLGIPLEGRRVLEVGCGVGHLSEVLLANGARLSSIDARKENVEESGRRVKLGHHISVADIQDNPIPWGWRFTFHIVFAYGILYHLTSPIEALRNMRMMLRPDGILALESIVLDFSSADPRDYPRESQRIEPLALLKPEHSYAANQGISNLALWPSMGFIYTALKGVGFEHVYQPPIPPDHPEFWRPTGKRWEYREPVHREIFIASDVPLTALNEVVY